MILAVLAASTRWGRSAKESRLLFLQETGRCDPMDDPLLSEG